ncbi:hypothetical protein HYC85_000334 [Camellia sinensis]|uniref:Uncharacterized protein n=1 Tax=Camellia sinensis TaxID=4442 RepID=A0A7J7I303_CAMSI|nr:hypothetical protein HYC85_000334 [Camellia sinensis]
MEEAEIETEREWERQKSRTSNLASRAMMEGCKGKSEQRLHCPRNRMCCALTHPIFGPESGKDGWKDLTFVYDRGCKLLEMSCEEHDRLAARSQFLTHTIGRLLSEMEIESTSIDTKNFQTQV